MKERTARMLAAEEEKLTAEELAASQNLTSDRSIAEIFASEQFAIKTHNRINPGRNIEPPSTPSWLKTNRQKKEEEEEEEVQIAMALSVEDKPTTTTTTTTTRRSLVEALETDISKDSFRIRFLEGSYLPDPAITEFRSARDDNEENSEKEELEEGGEIDNQDVRAFDMGFDGGDAQGAKVESTTDAGDNAEDVVIRLDQPRESVAADGSAEDVVIQFD